MSSWWIKSLEITASHLNWASRVFTQLQLWDPVISKKKQHYSEADSRSWSFSSFPRVSYSGTFHCWVSLPVFRQRLLKILMWKFCANTTCPLEQFGRHETEWWSCWEWGMELSVFHLIIGQRVVWGWVCGSVGIYGHAIKCILKEARCPFYWDHFCSFWSEFYFRISTGSPRRDLDYIACFLSLFRKGIKCNSFGIEELNFESHDCNSTSVAPLKS